MRYLPIYIIVCLICSGTLYAKNYRASSDNALETCQDRWDRLVTEKQISADYDQFYGMCDDELRNRLSELMRVNKQLSYDNARKYLFTTIDNFNGIVCDVYSEYCLKTSSIPNSSIMNTEHTWPQSLGATGIAKSDLHHLFPVSSKFNSTRSNYQFCDANSLAKEDSLATGRLLRRQNGIKCFEVPDRHKGNAARAMFYFSVRYSLRISDAEEKVLRNWSDLDGVDELEVERDSKIFEIQDNNNYFIHYPYLVNFISDF